MTCCKVTSAYVEICNNCQKICWTPRFERGRRYLYPVEICNNCQKICWTPRFARVRRIILLSTNYRYFSRGTWFHPNLQTSMSFTNGNGSSFKEIPDTKKNVKERSRVSWTRAEVRGTRPEFRGTPRISEVFRKTLAFTLPHGEFLQNVFWP